LHLLTWLLCSFQRHAAEACTSSGYCSVGKVHLFYGDIASSKALADMAERVSYRKELIFTIITDDLSYQVPLAHWWLGMLNMGWVIMRHRSCGIGCNQPDLFLTHLALLAVSCPA
jgi:hypothetical protein